MFDVCVIGAGPCGIFCSLAAREKGLSVALVECGNHYNGRICRVDNGNECLDCKPCNVISGFGGCIHYGDSAKLSYYPSGRELYRKLGNDDYNRLLEKACLYWGVRKEEFKNCDISTDGESFDIKSFPVRVMKSSDIKTLIENAWSRVKSEGVSYFQDEMQDYCEVDDGIIVKLKYNQPIRCKNIVLAMGRQGFGWLRQKMYQQDIKTETSISSMGVRFEMPKEFMIPLGRIHPDFKFRMEYKGFKYKTFCFCGGENGGRLKFENFGNYTLLDGHILTESDKESKYANFALMRQLIRKCDSSEKIIEIRNEVFSDYIKYFNGRPVYQAYESFKNSEFLEEKTGVSTKCVKPGAAYRLFKLDIKDYCFVAEKVFGVIAKHAACSIEDIISNTKVIGLEIEGLWNRISTDNYFKVDGKKVYIGGDCGGENQGIMQATISGIRIAEGLAR